jgi:hypothetical protein
MLQWLFNGIATSTMSFGFSIGDFVAVIELANRVRKEFVAAPSQFKSLSDEYVPGMRRLDES